MKTSGLSFILALAAGALAAEETVPVRGQGGERGVAAGERHAFRIQYANSWSEVALSPKTPGRAPGGPQDLEVARAQDVIRSLEVTPIGEDPLYLDMTLSLAATIPGRLELKVNVVEVRYFDDRGRRWTLKKGAPGAAEQAGRIVREAAAAWRNLYPLSLESEMLEEQMAGAAVFLLDGVPVAAELELPSGDPSLPGFPDLLREKLPPEFPAVIGKSVEWIFREAAAKSVGPPIAQPREGAEIDRRGVPCRVKKVKAGKGGALVLLEGQMYWQSTGVAVKESAAVEAGTGLAVEVKTVTIRDALRGRSHRFGATRWEVTRVRPETRRVPAR